MLTRILLRLLPAALAAGLLAAAPAQAYTDVAYSVEYEAGGEFTYADYDGIDDFWVANDIHMYFAYDGRLSGAVVFRDGHLFETWGSELPNSEAAGTWELRSSAGNQTCEGSDTHPSHGWTRIAPQFDDSEDVIPLDGLEHVYLRPFDEFEPLWSCPDDTNFMWDLVMTGMADGNMYEDGVLAPGANPFDMLFDLPPEAIGMGYVEQLIPTQRFEGEERCPTSANLHVVNCVLEWSGKIKLRKLWERQVAPSSDPVPPSEEPAPAEVDRRTARIDAKAGKARFDVSCTAACSGTAALHPAAAAKASASARRPLAVRRFALPAAGSERVTLRLGRSARRAFQRARFARLVVRTNSAGAPSTTTLRLRVRR